MELVWNLLSTVTLIKGERLMSQNCAFINYKSSLTYTHLLSSPLHLADHNFPINLETSSCSVFFFFFSPVSNLMGSLVGYRLTFQPTSEELVSHFLKKKSRDPAFTHPTIRDVNIYKHHPCELPGLASVQSDEQVWYFFCTLDNKYAKSDRASRTAKGGSWKITGAKRDVKAKHSNKPIGLKKTLVFYEGSNTRKENRTNWIMHEYHRNKDPLLKGKVIVCRIERKPNKKHHGPSSAVDEGQPSDYLVYDSGNNVAQHVIAAEIESQLLPNQHLSYNNTEDDVAEEVEHLLVHAEWDALIDYNELQSPISSSDSNVWITPLKSEQEDDFGNLKWDIRDGFFGEETGHSLPPDVNSSKKVTEAHIMLWEPLRCRDHCCFEISSMANGEY